MYSDKIREMIEDAGAEVGDRVEVNGKEGRLMPKPESGDPESLVLKLDSGYNIGLDPEEVELVEKREQGEREKIEVEHDEERPDILILHTGGTIASRVSYEEGGVKPAFDPEDLLEMYPELGEEVNVHSEVVAQMLSEDMEPGHWQDIAEKIDEVKDEYDGIIVGHGTDTMAFTGAALSFMLKGVDTGVLLVGSQRSSDRPSSDAAINLYSAAKFLTETEFNGIGVCMHETPSDSICSILPAHKVRKMHTSRRDAFSAINAEPLGEVDYEDDEVALFEQPENGRGEYELREGLDSSVGYIKARPGMETSEVEFLESQNYSGVVIEGTGLGHMPVNAFDDKTQHHSDILEKIGEIADDAAVVLASQCINGRTDMDVYDAGIKIKDAGVVEAGDMHPELAYVKLMWSLGQAEDEEEAKEIFSKNIAGELRERSVYSE
ncbi:MAG: Glu-tRNA(Gln) amidotransferase subunit GatD [Candidatus Nanohaloarchaea archaeon]